MSVGDQGYAVLPGYVAIGKETTWGTYASASSGVEAISCSFKVEIDSQKLDTIGRNRGFSKRVMLNKMVGGEIQSYLHPVESSLLLMNAMAGAVVSTAGSTGAYTHSVTAGNYDTTTAILGISANVKKGNFTFRYNGGRVNTAKISATVGEPVKCSFDMIFKDATQQSDDIGSILSVSSFLPMTFANGVFRYKDSEVNAATTTAVEPIQSFELTIKNNLESENPARQLGSNLIAILPAKRRDIELKVTQRFDTTTGYLRFIQATIGAAELVFTGPDSISATRFTRMTMRLPKLYQNSNDPTLDKANEILSSEFTYDVVVDNPNTVTGKDIGLTIENNVSAY